MSVMKIDLKREIRNPLNPQYIPLSNWLLVVLFAVIAFLAYNQAFDMRLTMLQSSDLIDCTLNGNFFHFYEYTLQKSALKAYFPSGAAFMGAAYNIVMYVVLAAWALPVYLINKLHTFSDYASILEIFFRSLFSRSPPCRMFGRIGNSCLMPSANFFATSP